MDNVREFDRVLKQKEEQQFLMIKVLQILFFFMGGIMMFWPLEMTEEMAEIYLALVMPAYLLGAAVVFSLQPYMFIKDGQKLMSIYKLLEYMPVDREDIFKVRREYLNGICKKVLIAYVVCQCMTAVLIKEFTVITILYPVVMTAGIWFVGMMYIRSGIRR